jgi:hypothetical protein
MTRGCYRVDGTGGEFPSTAQVEGSQSLRAVGEIEIADRRLMTAELTIDGDAQLLQDWNLLQRAQL